MYRTDLVVTPQTALPRRPWAALFLCGCCLLTRAAAAETTAPAPAEVRYLAGLTYSVPSPKVELKLDLACPKNGNGPFPAVVCIHGGGWVKGSRDSNRALLELLARNGYVAVSVSYRLAPVDNFRVPVHDVKCAVRWLRANAAKYKIDPGRIGVIGYSSGGQLALLLGATAGDRSLEGKGGHEKFSSRVQAVVGYYPITDLTHLHAWCGTNEPPVLNAMAVRYALETYLKGPPAKAGEAYARASPVSYPAKDAAPTLLIHGTSDTLVPVAQSRRLAQKWKKGGAAVELIALEGADHNFGGAHARKADAAALRFLDRHLKPVVARK